MTTGGGVVGVGAEHAHQLGDDLALAELDDGRTRRLDARVLDDREVARAERGDLRQVGDAQHLAALAQLAQPRADGARGLTADAGVDLVEDERASAAEAPATLMIASITRESSPPEAISRRGRPAHQDWGRS